MPHWTAINFKGLTLKQNIIQLYHRVVLRYDKGSMMSTMVTIAVLMYKLKL